MRELATKVAVVTGAARGIGRCLALELADAGMDVVLADLDEMGMQAVRREVEERGRRALCVRTDVSKLEPVQHLLQRTLAELGSCHLVVNNAGVFHGNGVLDASDEQWERVIATNLWGPVHACRVFGRHFVAQGEGHIVNLASGAGLLAVPGMTAYSPSKFAVVGLSQLLRWELADQGVGVTVVCPGVVRTDISRAPGAGLEHLSGLLDSMLQRAPSPEKLARKVVRAVRRDRPMVLYGFEAYAGNVLRRMPSRALDPIGKWVARRILTTLRG